MGHRCEPPRRAVARFHYGDIVRFFVHNDRIGLPSGAFLRLSTEPAESLCAELPEQRPLREHQTLVVPQDSGYRFPE